VTRRAAAFGSLVFVVAQPGLMGGLVPYWLTGGWESSGPPLVLKVLGATLLAALLVAGPGWILILRLWRPQRRVRVGVVDQAESDDALPGAVAVRRTAEGELELTGRPDGSPAPHRAGR
jgi:hypothetical protein